MTVANGEIFSFLWLIRIHCVCARVCLGVCTDHIFFIHSSFDRHLLIGCFHILAIVNNAVMNIQMHIFFDQCSYFLWKNTQKWNC